ncbi:MAG TPA: SUMF1/EgtB/PvdO family nonheme iron enzyme, partial [Myxococcota bacterium]|nr:SUMF1/EgtB/PvdO family nonheme iron enzyme [Myxococcota bacterium]
EKANCKDEDALLTALERAIHKLALPSGAPPPEPVKARGPDVAALPRPVPEPPRPAPAAPAAPGVEMIDVPGGFAWRGCNKGIDPDCPEDEQPGKLLELKAFAIDKTEVTVAQYMQCVSAGRCSQPDPAAMQAASSYGFGYAYSFGGAAGGSGGVGLNFQQPGRENHPMNGVTWRQAREYCAYAGKRLPTEAEWEKAARGPKGVLYAWGMDPPTCERAVMSDDENGEGCGQGGTAEVCSRPEGNSPFGLCDMAGNVWEWVEDMYAEDYYTKSPGADPTGPRSGSQRSLRGGSYKYGIKEMRASSRSQYGEEQVADDIGFRCAKSL